MNQLLIKWLVTTLAILAASYLLDGIHASGFLSALFAAAMLGLLNAFFRPVLFVLTLPITILTLGLFTFILNALMLKMASGVIPGFEVEGFWTAIFGAVIVSIVSSVLNALLKEARPEHPEVEIHDIRFHRQDPHDAIDLEKRGDDRWE